MKCNDEVDRLRYALDRDSKKWFVAARKCWPKLLAKLRQRYWYSYQTRHEFETFLMALERGTTGIADAAAFLNETIDALVAAGDTKSLERLHVHVTDSMTFQRTKTLAPVIARLDPRTVKSSYVFTAEGEYTASQLEKLSPARKRQFLVAAKKFLPGTYKQARAFFDAFAEDGGVTTTCWRIALADKPKVPVYEMWTFLVDNGTVFATNKATPLGVQMIQGSFQAEKQTKKLRALAEDLARTVPF
jgi:hypothetical protein